MSIDKCPNFNLEENKELVKVLGKGKALAALTLNDNEPLSVDKARKLLGEQAPDSKLDRAIGRMLKSMGVSIEHIPNTGQNFNAIADTLNKTIRIVEGKVQIDTLSHEATHHYLDLLPPDSKLLNDILSDVKNRDEYDQIYEQYKDDPSYRNGDTVDETMIAKETAAHIIDDIIVGKYLDKKAMKWWERLWNWIKNLVNNIKQKVGIINEETMSPYEQVAEDILGNKISKLDLKRALEANLRGEVYKQLDSSKDEYADKLKSNKSTSDIQKTIIDQSYLDPAKASEESIEKREELRIKPNPVRILDPIEQVYRNPETGEPDDRVSELVQGEMPLDKQILYKPNADAGTTVHKVFEDVTKGNEIDWESHPLQFEKGEDGKYTEEAKMLQGWLTKEAKDHIAEVTADGSIILPEVTTTVEGVSGTIDALVISTKGMGTILDYKTSVHAMFNKDGSPSDTYDKNSWEKGEGSVFNEYQGTKDGKAILDNDGKLIPREFTLGENGEKIYEGHPIKLSKKLGYHIQVSSYAKMKELQGIPITGARLRPYLIDLGKYENGESFIKNIKRDKAEWDEVDLNENQPYVNVVIPTPIDESSPSKLQQDRPGYDYFKEPEYNNPEETEKLKKQSQEQFNAALDSSPESKKIAQEVLQIVTQREEYLRGLSSSKQDPVIHGDTIQILEDMKRDMMSSLKKNKYSSVLNEWMDYTIRQSARTSTYLSDPIQLDKGKFTAIAEQARKFIQGYSYINSLINQVQSTQIVKFNEAVGAVNNLRQSLEDAVRNWFMYHYKTIDTKYLEEEIHNYIYGNPEDIGIFTRLIAPPSGTSSIPVSLAFKEITDANFKAMEAWNEFTETTQIANKEFYTAMGIKSPKSDTFDFMANFDKGQTVQRVGLEYRQEVINAQKQLEDKDGQRKDFRRDDTPEAIDYNIQLLHDMGDYTRLTEAETYIPTEYGENGELVELGHYIPGEYCEYTPVPIYDEDGNITGYNDFVKDRENFEKQNPITGKWVIQFSPDAVKGLRWMKDGDKYYEEKSDGTKGRLLSDNERRGLAALQYRNKYYYPIEKTVELEFIKGDFTGRVKEVDDIQWIIKPENKSVRDKSTSKKDLRDKKYLDMMNDHSPQGLARWNYYKKWTASMDKLSLQLPVEMREHMKGKIPVQSSSTFDQLMNGDIPQTKMSLLKEKWEKLFSSTYVGERQIDETGNIKHSIPVGYTGSFKDQEKIDRLQKEIDQLDSEWNKIKDAATSAQKQDYKKQRDMKSAALKTEQMKIQPYQVERNLAKSLDDFAMKVLTFSSLSKAESNFLMIREMAAIKDQKKEMAQTDPMGRSLFKKTMNDIGTSLKKHLTGGSSNELKRIDDMMTMLFYQSEEYPGSFWGKLEQLPITLASLNLFLINPPVSFGVSLMMKSIHLREAAVGQFFNLKQFAKAEYDANKAIGQYISNEAVKTAGGEGKKFASHLEAVIAKTQAFTKGLSDESGLKQLLMTEHWVEWTGVATGAAAMMMNTKVMGLDGTITDAYKGIWIDKPNGDIELKPNYADSYNKIKFSMNRRMADYQNRFHGAYAPIERASLTKYPGGKSIMFLHKWPWAMLSNRLGGRMVHSNLGITEGSYITLYNFVKDVIKDKNGMMKAFQEGYRDMLPKGRVDIKAFGIEKWSKLSKEEKQEQQQKADDSAYEQDPNFKKTDGSTNWAKVERDRDTRRLELSNMKRNLFDVVYLMIATAAFLLFKSIAEERHDESRRWANFIAKSFDRLRRQQLFAMPVIGLEEEYTLLKSPIASLRIMGEFAEAFSATFGLVVPPYDANYYTNGIHKGELKAKVKWENVIPGANLVPWFQNQNNPNFFIK